MRITHTKTHFANQNSPDTCEGPLGEEYGHVEKDEEEIQTKGLMEE